MSAEPITITMLGGSGTGKTCFLVGMYGVMRRGVKGFTFAAEDLDVDLDLAKKWKAMRNETADKRWPAATDQSDDYRFGFCYAYDTIRRFDWHDYRGGALEEGASAEKAALIERLAASKCVLLCFSAEHLADPGGVSEDGADQAALLNRLMKEVREKAHGREQPGVVVVLTKYDLVDGGGRTKAQVIAEVHRLFSPLFAPGGGWTATVCQVSLGRALAGDPGRGEVKPISIHLPVAFAVYNAVQQEATAAARELGAQRGRLDAAQQKGWLSRWLDGDDVAGLQAETDQTAAQIAELKGKLKLLFEELVAGVAIYQDGMETKDV